ncbi:MAG: CPBP family intramembrane metalloprotease, partial [Prolixibacteraceae bacterium]|nr:CPBP family intramembrane metalloprotease [Prolixibacteraceae bacterium]
LSQILAMVALGISMSEKHFHPNTFKATVFELFMLGGIIAVVAIFRKWVDRDSFKSMGFQLRNFRSEALVGTLLGMVMIATGFLLLLAFHQITWVGTNPDATNMLLSLLLFVEVAFAEELFFRGYILNNLMCSMNRWVALLISSLFFSAVHMGNAHFTSYSFLSIVMAGLLLGLPYIFTKSLWMPIALHFSWNFFQGTIFGFSVSGNAIYSLITQTRTADTIWNGGEFGFEGSLLAVIFLALAIRGFTLYYRRKEQLVLSTTLVESIIVSERES